MGEGDTNQNKREREELAGNHTHLDSASCVKHLGEIECQPSKLSMCPDQERRGACCHCARTESGQGH